MVRWQTCELINIQLAKGKRLKPTDILQFAWEKKANDNLSKEQIDAIFAKWDSKKLNDGI